MKLAAVFPGQGAGIDREVATWCRSSAAVRRLVEVAARAAGIETAELIRGIGRPTMPTEQLEPLLTAVCLGIHAELAERGVRPDAVVGYSLGEIAACGAAGCCAPEAAVALAAERGRLMAREASRREGGMISIRVASRETVEQSVAWAAEAGIIGIAGQSAPGQWVISGEWAALRRMATRHPPTPVAVTGAWHSQVLAAAVAPFQAAAERAITRPLATPLVANRTGRWVERAEDLPLLLAEQLTHPIEWVRCMETLASAGVTDVVSVGPGRIVRGLVRFNMRRDVTLHATDDLAALERIAEACAA